MLSLDNALNEEELRDFLNRIGDTPYVTELKLDGLSMAAHYRDGQFALAVTRGDGEVGEDVTENARTIRSLPLSIHAERPELEARGEAMMNRRGFERLNAERDEQGSGSLRQSSQCRGRGPARARSRSDRLAPPRFLRLSAAGGRRARV